MDTEITVYDDYKIPINKYPRINTDKEKTDILIIVFLMHEDFLKKLGESYDKAITFYNNCKEYYYVFKFNNQVKQYSAQEIMTLKKTIDDYLTVNKNNVSIQLHYLKRLNIIDVIFYFYIRNKDFYINLFKSLEHAKKSYFERREYNYSITTPVDFYNTRISQIYNAIELMEINAYAQFLIQNKIIKELPTPVYIL
jgi:hypothetical protein